MYNKKEKKQERKRFMIHQIPHFKRPWLAAVLALLLLLFMTGCSDSPEEVPEPLTGTVLSGYAPKDASQITVALENTGACVVMLKDTSDRTLLSFYVRAGETVTVNVPAERMYVHFAGGKHWYGEELLFGKDTVYNKDPELTDFTEYSWTYELDSLTEGEFEVSDTEEEIFFPTEAEAYIFDPVQTESDDDYSGYLGDLTGNWESVYLEDGSSTLNVSAMAFPQTVYNCTQMTIEMEVEMNAGTSCKNWQVWGRSGNTFVKLDQIYLAAGNGYTSQTLYFSTPVTFDAIAVTPTIVGGYSWSIALAVNDVWVETY